MYLEMLLTRRSVVFDIFLPFLPGRVLVVRQVRRPRPLDNVLGPLAIHDDLVAKPARLGEHLQIQRVGKVVCVDDRLVQRILRPQRHGAAGPGPKQLRDHGEGVLVVHGELVELLRSAVQLRREELDVGLLRGQAHRVSPRLARRAVPQLRILQPVVESGEGEWAEWEGRQESCLLFLPLGVRLLEVVVVVDQVVVGQTWFVGLVEDKDNLEIFVSADAYIDNADIILICIIASYQVVHQVLSNTRQVNQRSDTMLLELLFGANAGAVQDIRAAVRSSADNDLSLRVNMARFPIAVHHSGSDGFQLSIDLLDEDLVDSGIDHESDVVSMVFLGNVIG